MLPPRLLMIHDARARRQHNQPDLPRRQQLHHPLLQVPQLDVVAGGYHAGLVEAVGARRASVVSAYACVYASVC